MHVVISALLFICSLPPVSMPVVGCFFLLPTLIHHLKNKNSVTWHSAALLGILLSSYIYFGAWTYSLSAYLLAISLTTASVVLIITALIFLINYNKLLTLFIVPCIWVGIEIALHSIQIPSAMSLVLTPTKTLLMPAAVGGQYVLGALVVLFQIIFLLIYISTRDSKTHIFAFSIFTPILILLILSSFDTPTGNNTARETINISIVQSNIHPLTTLDMSSDGSIESLYSERLKFIKDITQKNIKTDLIIWPEVNFSKYEFRNNNNIGQLAKQYKVNMLVASPDISPSRHSYSSIFAVSSDGTILSRQSKRLLIPFIENDIYKENGWKPHNSLPGKPGTIVCFESAFPLPAAMLASSGAGFIAIMTNDAYAGPSIIPLIHFELARIRAVETGKTIIRAANGGPSAIIDQSGSVIYRIPLFSEGVISKPININYHNTFFVKHFDMIMNIYKVISIISFLILLILVVRKKSIMLTSRIQYKAIGYIVISSTFLILFQYQFIKYKYTGTTNKSLPAGFINFQNGLINTSRTYQLLKASSTSESLISSITFLLRDYGNRINKNSVSAYFTSISNAGDNIDIIDSIANQYNYSIKNINYIPDNHDIMIATPCLALLNNGETIVVREYSKNHTLIFSPFSATEIDLKTSSFIKKWTGRTIVFNTKRKHWDL